MKYQVSPQYQLYRKSRFHSSESFKFSSSEASGSFIIPNRRNKRNSSISSERLSVNSIDSQCRSSSRYSSSYERNTKRKPSYEIDDHNSWKRSKFNHQIEFQRDAWYSDLPLEWWERNEDCKDAKSDHMMKIDRLIDRERLVLMTTLYNRETCLEPNMFPYATPKGIEHYTLWCRHDMSHNEIVAYVDDWLGRHFPQVHRWQYDDNSGERSISLFHVHVFIEMKPFSFTPAIGQEYIPPHCQSQSHSQSSTITSTN